MPSKYLIQCSVWRTIHFYLWPVVTLEGKTTIWGQRAGISIWFLNRGFTVALYDKGDSLRGAPKDADEEKEAKKTDRAGRFAHKLERLNILNDAPSDAAVQIGKTNAENSAEERIRALRRALLIARAGVRWIEAIPDPDQMISSKRSILNRIDGALANDRKKSTLHD